VSGFYHLCIFLFCIDAYGSPDLALAVRWGLFYIPYDSGSFLLLFYFNIQARWIGEGNLGGMVGLAYA